MGGRGSASGMSGRSVGISVTRDGETTDYFFTRHGSQNYYQRGIEGMPEPTPYNMSARVFKERVTLNGAAVREIPMSEKKEGEEAYKEDRKKTDEFLNLMDAQLGGNRAEHRKVTASRRGTRRRR